MITRKSIRLSNKSQLYSQIFIYVLTMVIVSFILIYGYNSITDFKYRADKVACLKFKNDLSNSIYNILSDYGSVKRKDIQLCQGYRQVCFIETFQDISDKEKPEVNVNPVDPIILDNIKSGTGKNTFLVGDVAKESFYIGTISVDKDVLCINVVNNKISLKLEGKGNHVIVSQ